jgi:hypothetical protein
MSHHVSVRYFVDFVVCTKIRAKKVFLGALSFFVGHKNTKHSTELEICT